MLKSLLFAALAGLALSTAHANDSTFGGAGSNLIPITNADIRMVDETILIDGRTDHSGNLIFWETEVTFHFRNESDQPQKLTIGFPFHPASQDAEEVGQFKAIVRGRPVTAKKIDLNTETPGYVYTFAYVWEMEFAPRETVEVKNSYLTGLSESNGNSAVHYILKTGANWKDQKIGHSHIEIRPHIPFGDCLWGQTRPEGYRIVKEKNLKEMVWEKKFVWDLKDYTPEEDVYGCILTRQNYEFWNMKELGTEEPKAEPLRYEALSAEELRIARNMLYARHGYIFKSPDLKRYFSGQAWYRENPRFDPKLLTKDELRRIREIKAFEAKLQSTKQPRKPATPKP